MFVAMFVAMFMAMFVAMMIARAAWKPTADVSSVRAAIG
jgi:hypothetical protein